MAGGRIRDRAIVVQQKTERPVQFGLQPAPKPRAVQVLLGHAEIESTVRHLGVDVQDAPELAERTGFCPAWTENPQATFTPIAWFTGFSHSFIASPDRCAASGGSVRRSSE